MVLDALLSSMLPVRDSCFKNICYANHCGIMACNLKLINAYIESLSRRKTILCHALKKDVYEHI